jgi:hypothetical protein
MVTQPVAGQNYNVVVQVHNPYNQDYSNWNLYVCWAIPTASPIPISNTHNLSAPPYGTPISVAANTANKQYTFPWTPSYENGGHECIIAAAYEQDIGAPGDLIGDGSEKGSDGEISVAQHNFGVLPVGTHHKRFTYPFQVFNIGKEEREFVVEAQQASLERLADFHRSLPGGKRALEKPGKVERLGISESTDLERIASEAINANPAKIVIAPRSCRKLMLSGVLPEGNALLNVTSSFRGRVIGGFSVFLMAEEKRS